MVRRCLSAMPFCLFLPFDGCLTFPLGVCIASENLLSVSPFLCWLVGKKFLEVPSLVNELRYVSCRGLGGLSSEHLSRISAAG